MKTRECLMTNDEGRRNDEARMTNGLPVVASSRLSPCPNQSSSVISHSFVIRHSSFVIPPRHSPRGFTLIELLIVIAIMAVLAALTFPILGAVKKNMIRTRARGGLTALETAIEGYKDKFGHYPPDNGGLLLYQPALLRAYGYDQYPCPCASSLPDTGWQRPNGRQSALVPVFRQRVRLRELQPARQWR